MSKSSRSSTRSRLRNVIFFATFSVAGVAVSLAGCGPGNMMGSGADACSGSSCTVGGDLSAGDARGGGGALDGSADATRSDGSSANDLAGKSADLSPVSVARDLGAHDLVTAGPDATLVPDLTSTPDLVVASAAPDLQPGPDLVVALCNSDGGACTTCSDDTECTSADAGVSVDSGNGSDGGAAQLLHCDTAVHACVECVSDGQCAAGNICNGDRCVPGCSTDSPCTGGLSCCNGTCADTTSSASNCGVCGRACNQGQACCSSACTSITIDANNCGGCGMVCSSNHNTPVCSGGVCIAECAGGYGDCNNNVLVDGCESSLNDPNHCGSCGAVCSTNHITNPTCIESVCNAPCDDGYADCDNDPSNGCEADLGSVMSCGGCGKVCSTEHATPTCSGATLCIPTCDPGYANCDGDDIGNGCEVDILNFPSNCGACGAVCSSNNVPGRTCVNGSCMGMCVSGYGDCDHDLRDNGCETELDVNDINNCGGCGFHCSGNNVLSVGCASGQCTGSCAPGYADCDNDRVTNGCESELDSDPNNCTGCNLTCPHEGILHPTCTAGVCGGTCGLFFADCDQNPANGCEIATDTDALNCGACGNSCLIYSAVINAACVDSTCTGQCAPGSADCNHSMFTDGCEVSTNVDLMNCGGCGNACSTENIIPLCSSGLCAGTCKTGYDDCNNDKLHDGCETDLTTSAYNCGQCGAACTGGKSCVNSTCQ